MKHTKISFLWNPAFLKKLTNSLYAQSFLLFFILSAVAFSIWLIGPYLNVFGHYPLLSPEKRIYLIVFIFLSWTLKLLVFDMGKLGSTSTNSETLNKLEHLQERFRGAMAFLKKTAITRNEREINLHELPWFLLIGPKNSGKTHLLAKSNVNFILQKQFSQHEPIPASENCDWWVTPKACLVDVPSHYILATDKQKHPFLWQSLLSLVKKEKGKTALQGLVITLALPEIMQEGTLKDYHPTLHILFQRLFELKKYFPQPLPVYLIITKCDQLPGFLEFFGESSNEETDQVWGFQLSNLKGKKWIDVVQEQLNVLIKKINQQLLWRLHQERNTTVRPAIKDFPLQVEQLKAGILDVVKKYANLQNALPLKGIYLTSAYQNHSENDLSTLTVNEANPTSTQSLQIFKAPEINSRAYFIKQFISQALTYPTAHPQKQHLHWIDKVLYATAAAIVVSSIFIFGKDFQQGIQKIYGVREDLSTYQFSLQATHDPDEHLVRTLALINFLKTKVAQPTGSTSDKALEFYSNKSQAKINLTYQETLHTLLLPAVKNYLAEYLKNPVNKNTDQLYAALKAYLMLGDQAHLDPLFITETIKLLPPKSLNQTQHQNFIEHLEIALKSNPKALALDKALIEETRHYFTSLPSFQLAYIILKTMGNNIQSQEIAVNFAASTPPIFKADPVFNKIPMIFSAKQFPTIANQSVTLAATEAVTGNWVLGKDIFIQKNLSGRTSPILIEQLRNTYVSSYVSFWEDLLTNIHLNSAKNLEQMDAQIVNLVSNQSPLLQLLKTVYENTYFEPILSSSPKLQQINALIVQSRQNNNLLYQIFSSLQSLHQFLQPIAKADNVKKAAFSAVSVRMKNSELDALTQLRMIALKSPEPIKNWLDKIADDTWQLLMADSTQYIDISWQNEVMEVYKKEIADRYPFNTKATDEVQLSKFSHFFGASGIMINFYQTYLEPFVDTSREEWHWKSKDGLKLSFSDVTLRQIQYAIRIHHTFFPQENDQLNLSFSLKPYKFSKQVKQVKWNINQNEIIDEKNKVKNVHIINWPSQSDNHLTQLEVVLANQKTLSQTFTGEWGLFKLINQTFETAVTKKEMLIDLTIDEHHAKYLLFTEDRINPFMSLNLRHFNLPSQLA